MSDSDLLYAIKKISDDVNKASKPVEIASGQVASINPLSVKADQKLTIPEKALVLTDAVRDHEVEITISGLTDSDGDNVSGTSVITIHNALKVGESVLMIRKQGGQQYLIIGRGDLS